MKPKYCHDGMMQKLATQQANAASSKTLVRELKMLASIVRSLRMKTSDLCVAGTCTDGEHHLCVCPDREQASCKHLAVVGEIWFNLILSLPIPHHTVPPHQQVKQDARLLVLLLCLN